MGDIKSKLVKLLEYYESYSKIFPNYIVLHESKYLYKNIQKKQKMIDNIQLYEYNKNHKENISIITNDGFIFNTEVYNSILNQTVSVCQSHKDNSLLLKAKKGKKDSKDSLEKLIDNIGFAEENESKRNLLFSEYKTITSNQEDANERRTIEVSTSKTIKIGISNKFENNIFQNKFSSGVKRGPKISSDFGMKAIKEKLAESLKNKFDINSTTYATNKSKSKDQKRKMSKVEVKTGNTGPIPVTSNATHKPTQSMPKLTNNIFYIINPQPQLNAQITIYQNINNTGKTSNFSPPMTKDFNLTNNLARSSLRTSTEKKKSYKKLLRPELLGSINETAKKNPYDIKITKVQNNTTKRIFDVGDTKHSRDHNNLTTRNVK
jgi:hypothetical protein